MCGFIVGCLSFCSLPLIMWSDDHHLTNSPPEDTQLFSVFFPLKWTCKMGDWGAATPLCCSMFRNFCSLKSPLVSLNSTSAHAYSTIFSLIQCSSKLHSSKVKNHEKKARKNAQFLNFLDGLFHAANQNSCSPYFRWAFASCHRHINYGWWFHCIGTFIKIVSCDSHTLQRQLPWWKKLDSKYCFIL